MKIKSAKLFNYRNYEFANIDFDGGLNTIIGLNAQGKTNLLEAIYFCSIGKSLRTNKEKEVIKWDCEIARIEVIVEKKFSKSKIEIIFSKKNKKTIKINDIPIKKIGELLGELNCVFFSPDELKLIKDSPNDRRRFMDISISQTSKNYFYLLNRYDKVLANRNRLLKVVTDLAVLKDTISIWNEQLSDLGSKIIKYRCDFLKELSPFTSLAHSYLTSFNETIALEYSSNINLNGDNLKNDLFCSLEKSVDKDFKLGFTSVGPHRDDIKVLVNNVDIKTFGSQGQQRTCALSMKLAEVEIIKNKTGESPVLLLDDVFSELDEKRRKKLINFCEKTQTLITCTEFEFSNILHKKIVIKNGKNL
ncbi:MAG: DNA replication/repair protein RecF [Clostridia bacterium]